MQENSGLTVRMLLWVVLLVSAVGLSRSAGSEVQSVGGNVCSQPKVVGPCRAAIPRWYFNTEKKMCEEFTYGGCDANGNNFKSKAECEAACPSQK